MKKVIDSKMFKISTLIIKVVVTLLIVLIVGVIVVQRLFNNNVSVFGYRIFTIITESMVPEYNVYDVVISKEISANKIKVGDDVVYIGNKDDFADKVITHRVIAIEHNSSYDFHTKGIANDIEDPLVNESQIYGVVTNKSSVLSIISGLVNNPYGFYFLIFIPLAILVTFEIIDFKNRKAMEE